MIRSLFRDEFLCQFLGEIIFTAVIVSRIGLDGRERTRILFDSLLSDIFFSQFIFILDAFARECLFLFFLIGSVVGSGIGLPGIVKTFDLVVDNRQDTIGSGRDRLGQNRFGNIEIGLSGTLCSLQGWIDIIVLVSLVADCGNDAVFPRRIRIGVILTTSCQRNSDKRHRQCYATFPFHHMGSSSLNS